MTQHAGFVQWCSSFLIFSFHQCLYELPLVIRNVNDATEELLLGAENLLDTILDRASTDVLSDLHRLGAVSADPVHPVNGLLIEARYE